MNTKSSISAGPNTGGRSETSSFAVTQAAWRFFNNKRVTLPDLIEPLQELGRLAAYNISSPFVLVAHDWSQVANHNKDADTRTHRHDIGYDLACALLVDADNGNPLAPMAISLQASHMVHSTWKGLPSHTAHINQVLPLMESAQEWKVPRELVHVIDREADSVDHFRQWDKEGYCFLVRVDDRKIVWQNQETLLSKVADGLTFQAAGQAYYRGQKTHLITAETTVILHRPARRNIEGRKVNVPGRPLSMRFTVARLIRRGKVLAQWFLLTNIIDDKVTAATIARWYYWRWRIESFFKLLKSAGHELEHWKQETASAIAKRLLVAAMACVVVWELERTSTREAEEMKKLLMRLSGRAVKRSKPVTSPGLLAGLFVLLPILDLLESSGRDPTELCELAYATIPFLRLKQG